MSRNKELFKDRITKSKYSELIAQLSFALDNGNEALKELLFGETKLIEYTGKGSYQEGQHCECIGLKKQSFTEKRLCKCLFYYNSDHFKKCEACDFRNRYMISGDYFIKDYEVPAFYFGDGIGEIDLVISPASDETVQFATEVKPAKDEFDPNDKGNQETLLRMIAEIMTYTFGYPEGKYYKAIGFFENTPQETEYLQASAELIGILKKAHITVFRFERAGEKGYRICKL